MDVVTLALAKQYTDNQRLAYAEGQHLITWDGDEEGKFIIPMGDNNSLVRVSENIIDLSKAVKVVSKTIIDNETAGTQERTDFEFYSEYPLNSLDTSGGMLVMTCAEDADLGFGFTTLKGTYMMMGRFDSMKMFVSEILFAETIHPIDPKYIPAVDALILNGTDGKQYRLAVDESGTLAATEVV